MARRLAIPLTVLGGVIFVIAAIVNSNPVYGVALLVSAASLACFLTFPLNPHARWPRLAQGGLVLAIIAAVVDAAIDFADAVGTESTITTILIAVGSAAAIAGRTTGPAGRGRA
ncbi:MAG: hypothetical protein QOH76_4004 [Thermoleophilaceae bacterium]|jgi:hypothetical protein|nr:hypothetical protein [Thermoleophilaceae bacterium]